MGDIMLYIFSSLFHYVYWYTTIDKIIIRKISFPLIL
jgi:hypothetical protein